MYFLYMANIFNIQNKSIEDECLRSMRFIQN